MMWGRFITLEGGEGVGKSTQLLLLADALRSEGKNVVTTREPGGTIGAEAIRTLLMTGTDDRWNARTEALLFAAARADHVAKLIRPAIERGDWVLCDRFVDSTRAYQGGAGDVEDSDIMALHQVGSAGLLPDRTLLLQMPPSEAAARAATRDDGKADRMGSKSAAYYTQVNTRFSELASHEPDRFRVIDASGSVDDVTTRLLAALSDLL
ncbi:MAG: dTMP kinase [Chakrabartia sp.]